MKILALTITVLALVRSARALDCEWDKSTDPDQGLDPASLAAGVRVDQVADASDPESCRAACCGEPDCDLALLGLPADGAPQCVLVTCAVRGRDACVLQTSSQFKVFRRKTEARGEAKDGGEKLHLVPLLDSPEPRTSETNETNETSETNETNETNSVRCRLPVRVGPCRAAFPRFYYHATNQSCRGFVFGGCDANANNFLSRDECEAACRGVTGPFLPDESTPAPPDVPAKAPRMAPSLTTKPSPDPEPAAESVHTKGSGMSAAEFAERCGAEPQTGPCRAAFQRWFYNQGSGACETFVFGGCKPNKNNYLSQSSCMDSCAGSVQPSSKSRSDGVSADFRGRCLVTPDPGPCRAAFPSFYYDPDAGTCRPFIYGGCRGNENRYDTAEECMSQCGGGSFESRGKARNRWTSAFFLFATLAVISALLLVTLVLVSLRRHRLSRRPSSVSDKEELLPDPDEQSSVDSLPVPESPRPDQA